MAKAALGRVLVACALIGLVGCGKPGPRPRAAVKGKVTLGDKAVTAGSVRFLADGEKGNSAPLIGVGKVGSEGEYELATDRGAEADVGPGLPLGWYKVIYIPGRGGPAVDSKYTAVATTPLSIEVVAEPQPGQYDIVVK
jgi:hypothetical protein